MPVSMEHSKLLSYLLLGLFMVSILPLVSAVPITETQPVGLTLSTTTDTADKSGMKINMNGDYSILKITKDSGTGATVAYVLDSSKNIVATSGAFSSNVATFSPKFDLDNGVDYYLVVDAGGGIFNKRFHQTGLSYPYAGTVLDWTGGLTSGSADTTTQAWDIISAEFEEVDTGPVVVLNSPEDAYVSNISTITFSTTVTDDIQIENVTLYINGVANETNSSGYNGTYTFQKTFVDGDYNWSILAFDNDSLSDQSVTRTFTIDTFDPVISIDSPEGLIEYHIIGTNLTLNTTITDPNLDSCWYDYNGTNNSFSCTSGLLATEIFISVDGETSLEVYANDTAGNIKGLSTSWTYQFIETNRTFNPVTLQTATETFQLTGVRDSSITTTIAILHYDGNEYTALKTGTGNNVIFTNIIGIPTYLNGTINFYWTITYTNSTGTYEFNTTTETQEVFALSLVECYEPSTSGLTLNFTTYETQNDSALNSSFEATFQFFAEGGAGSMIVEYLFSAQVENQSNYMFCLNSSGQNITLDAFISYSATDYDRREYVINDGIMGNFTQTIPLYLTQTTLTDIITIFVQDQGYDPIPGALVAIQEWNVGTNTYSTIGMLTTSSEGTGIIDLELYTTWYRAVVSIDGVIVEVTDVEKRSSTAWTITVETGVTNPYDLFGNIAHGLTFDEATNITSFTWLDVSGYTSRGCLVVQNITSTGPVTIFNDCTSSVSGTIDYQIIGDGDYNAYGVIFLEGYDVSQIVDPLNIRLGTPEITDKVSPFGKVISFIAIGTAGGIGVAAGSVILGSSLIIVVLFALMKIGFMNITSGFIWGIISILIIVILMERKKR